MYIKKVAIRKLNAAEYNPRKNLKVEDIEYKNLKSSMQQFGYVDPIIWNEKTGNIVGGHQRLKILIEQGYEEVEVSVVNLDIEKEEALNVALNKISGNWDIGKLSILMQEIVENDMASITGFSQKEIDKLLNQVDIESTINVVGEIANDDFSEEKFQHKCPRCGFLY